MRALRLKATLGCVALASAVGLAAAAPVALHSGDRIAESQLFAYLSYPVVPGDWVKYRVSLAGRFSADKTIGFGRERVSGVPTLFIETHVRTSGVTGLPSGATVGIGDDAVLKTYVGGDSFGDLAHAYRVVTTALKVGEFEYEIAPGSGESYSALTGAAIGASRDGRVESVEPVDMRIGDLSVHAMHVTASFPAVPLPVGGTDEAITLEVWQSPDVPLGTVKVANAGSTSVLWRLVAFGRGGYRSLFSKSLDRIRSASQPVMQ